MIGGTTQLGDRALDTIQRIIQTDPLYFEKMSGSLSYVPVLTTLICLSLMACGWIYFGKSTKLLSRLCVFLSLLVLGWFQGCSPSRSSGADPSAHQLVDEDAPVDFIGDGGVNLQYQTFVEQEITIPLPENSRLRRVAEAPASIAQISPSGECYVPSFSGPVTLATYRIEGDHSLIASSPRSVCLIFEFESFSVSVFVKDQALLAENVQREIDRYALESSGQGLTESRVREMAQQIATSHNLRPQDISVRRMPDVSGLVEIKILDRTPMYVTLPAVQEVQQMGLINKLVQVYSNTRPELLPETRAGESLPSSSADGSELARLHNAMVQNQFGLRTEEGGHPWDLWSISEWAGAMKTENWVGWHPTQLNLQRLVWWSYSPVGGPWSYDEDLNKRAFPPKLENRPKDLLKPILERMARNQPEQLGILFSPTELTDHIVTGDFVDEIANYFEGGLRYGQATGAVYFHGPVIKSGDRIWYGLLNFEAQHAVSVLNEFRNAYELIRSPIQPGQDFAVATSGSQAAEYQPAEYLQMRIKNYIAMLKPDSSSNCTRTKYPEASLALTSRFYRGTTVIESDKRNDGSMTDYYCNDRSDTNKIFSWMKNFDHFVRAQAMPGGSVTFFFNMYDKNENGLRLRPFDVFWILYLLTKHPQKKNFDPTANLGMTLNNTGAAFHYDPNTTNGQLSEYFQSGLRPTGADGEYGSALSELSERSLLPDKKSSGYSLIEYFTKIKRLYVFAHAFQNPEPAFYSQSTDLARASGAPFQITALDRQTDLTNLGLLTKNSIVNSNDLAVPSGSKVIKSYHRDSNKVRSIKLFSGAEALQCRWADLTAFNDPQLCPALEKGFIESYSVYTDDDEEGLRFIAAKQKLRVTCDTDGPFGYDYYDGLEDFIDGNGTHPLQMWLDTFEIRYWGDPDDTTPRTCGPSGPNSICNIKFKSVAPHYDWQSYLDPTLIRFQNSQNILVARKNQFASLFSNSGSEPATRAVLDYFDLIRPFLSDWTTGSDDATGIPPSEQAQRPNPSSSGSSTSPAGSSGQAGQSGGATPDGGPFEPCIVNCGPSGPGPDGEPELNNTIPKIQSSNFVVSSNVFAKLSSAFEPIAVGTGFNWYEDFYGGPWPLFGGFAPVNGVNVPGVARCLGADSPFCKSAWATTGGLGVCAPWVSVPAEGIPAGRTCGVLRYCIEGQPCPSTEPCPPDVPDPDQLGCICTDYPAIPGGADWYCKGVNPNHLADRKVDSTVNDGAPIFQIPKPSAESLGYWSPRLFFTSWPIETQIALKFKLQDVTEPGAPFTGFSMLSTRAPLGGSISERENMNSYLKLLGVGDFKVINASPAFIEKETNWGEAPAFYDAEYWSKWSYLNTQSIHPDWDSASGEHGENILYRNVRKSFVQAKFDGIWYAVGPETIVDGYRRRGVEPQCYDASAPVTAGSFLGVSAPTGFSDTKQLALDINVNDYLSREKFYSYGGIRRKNKVGRYGDTFFSDPPIGQQLHLAESDPDYDMPYIWPDEFPPPLYDVGRTCLGPSCNVPPSSDPGHPPPAGCGAQCEAPEVSRECRDWLEAPDTKDCCNPHRVAQNPALAELCEQSRPENCSCLSVSCGDPDPGCGGEPEAATPANSRDRRSNGTTYDLYIRRPDVLYKYRTNKLSYVFSGVTAVGDIKQQSFVLMNYNSNALNQPTVRLIGDGPHFNVIVGSRFGDSSLRPELMSIVVEFRPTSGGEKSATVELITNDLDENPFRFVVRGTAEGIGGSTGGGGGVDVGGTNGEGTAGGCPLGSSCGPRGTEGPISPENPQPPYDPNPVIVPDVCTFAPDLPWCGNIGVDGN